MPSSEDSSPCVGKCIADLHELAHDLSNSLGMIMNYLILDVERSGEASANLSSAIKLSIRSAEMLRSLMLELQRLDWALLRIGPFEDKT
jgi:predicted DNA-binding ribbon-helix-helix protein